MTGGWEEVKLDDGRVYYYHRLTRASRWDKPEGAVADAMEQRIQDQERQKQAAVEERRRKREVEKQAKDEEAKARDNLTHSVCAEVKVWAKGKSIHQLLNELDVIFEGGEGVRGGARGAKRRAERADYGTSIYNGEE